MPHSHRTTNTQTRAARCRVRLAWAAVGAVVGLGAIAGTGAAAVVQGPPAPARDPGPAPIRPMRSGPRALIRWRNPEGWTGRPSPILVATFPTDTSGDRASVAWFRTSRTAIMTYPGTGNPGTTAAMRGPQMVPYRARTNLLTTFNSGFYEKDLRAGFFTNNTLYVPMVRGLGTVVRYGNGHVDVLRWTGGPRPGRDVVMARQNLPLIAEGGRMAPGVNVSEAWGATLSGAAAVWRSGLGVDRNGNLMYLAAPNQTAPSLAEALIHAGAVRAMELDINPAWPILTTFGRPGGLRPSLFVPNPNQTATRFLAPSLKDFFAVYLQTTVTPTAGPF
jgi:hypothetical protein